MRKCILALLLGFALVLGIGATDIASADDLLALMHGSLPMNGDYRLTADITLPQSGQSPIGSTTAPFTGSFDGQGHTVSGLSMTTASTSSETAIAAATVGLFGNVGGGAVIQNFTLRGEISHYGTGAAGVCGTAAAPVTFDGITSEVNVTSKGARVGGIVGALEGQAGEVGGAVLLRNCVNKGKITAAGELVGGIAGRIYLGKSGAVCRMENCINFAPVQGRNYVGGLVGRFESGSATKADTTDAGIFSSANYGKITAIGNNASAAGVGGIAGLISTQAPFTADTLYNAGNVEAIGTTAGGKYAGGIVGYLRVYTNNTMSLSNLWNTGNVHNAGTADGGNGCVGGLFGTGSGSSGAYTASSMLTVGRVTSAVQYCVDPVTPTVGSGEYSAYYYYGAGNAPFTSKHGAELTDDALQTAEETVGLDRTKWVVVNGHLPELAEFHTHVYGEWLPTEGGHHRVCYCGATTAKEAHTYKNSLCTVCGASSCAHGGTKTYKTTKTAATCVAGGIDVYVCALCGQDVEVASKVNPKNHTGEIAIRSEGGSAVFACADCGESYRTRKESDVYVSAKGISTLTVANLQTVGSESAPFASFADAMRFAAALAGEGKTVQLHVLDTATLPSDYVSPEYSGSIIISGGRLTTENRFTLGGALTVEQITLAPSKATVYEARGNKIVMGEGIVMGSSTAMYVVGGWDSHFSATADVPTQGFCTDVTIRSGKFSYVSGGNRDMKAEYRGEIKLTVGAVNPQDTLTVTKILCTASLGDDYATEAKLTLTLDGRINFAGTGILYMLSGSQRGERCNFDADIYLSARIENCIGVRYHGNYTADLYVDPAVDGIDKTVAELMQGEAQLHPMGSTAAFAAKDTDKPFGAVGVQSFVWGNVRVTVLSDTVVRVEEKVGGGFVDAATLVVPDRAAFGGAAVATDTVDGIAVIKTAELIINLPAENASADDVRIYGKDGKVLFDFYTAHMNGFYSSLPEPAATPDAYVLVDNGILPAGALVYSGSPVQNSGWQVSDNVDYYVVATGGDSAKLRRDFYTLTGSTAMSGIKFYGSWYSRWSNFTGEEKLAMIEDYRRHDIPLDAIVIDTEWRADTDGTGYETNPALYPDMGAFLDAAEKAGVYVLFNDHTHNTSSTILTPSELMWQSDNIKALLKLGLDGWWYDRNWSYTIKSPYTNVLYSTLGQKLYYDTIADYYAENGGRRVLMLSNADWLRHGFLEGKPSVIGHRYGMQWSGDIYGDAVQLGREIENAVLSGVVGGSPYISADLGGFRNNDNVSENEFIRWMQFGAFSAALRVHSDINPKNPQYPWSYTERAETVVRSYFQMRYHLMPYLYSLAFENSESGMPLLRRLDFHYPEYAESQDNTQYLLGRDILVAPYNGALGEGSKIVPTAWLKNAAGENGLDAAYYDVEGVAKNKYFDGEPAYTETVPEVNFFWDQWSPNGVGTDHFAARFTGTVTPGVDCYIGLIMDDGGRIYIDGKLFSGSWTNKFDQAEMNTNKYLKAGVTYEIVIEYYEAASKAQLYFVYDEATAPDTSTRSVFLPDGEWMDVFTGEIFTGPVTVQVTKGVESSPIFVRRGAILPAAAVESPLTGADWQTLSLNVYGKGDGSAVLYEDDGETENYRTGDYRLTEMTAVTDGDRTTLTVSAAEGGFETGYGTREIAVRIHSDTPITSALVDGQPASVVKVGKDSAAIPFAERGASPEGDVYEIVFSAAIDRAHTVVYVTAPNGDVNGDGRVTVQDALLALRGLLNDNAEDLPDFSGDGVFTLIDVIRVLKLCAE